MPKDRCKAIDFVELKYDGQLLQFMGKVSCAILMAHQCIKVKYMKNGENYPL
jgi:hypothetical protein